jgi:hypothetical protein
VICQRTVIRPRSRIDVVPGDATQLAAAQAGEGGQVVERVKPVPSITSRKGASSSAVQIFTLGTTALGSSASGATLRTMRPAFTALLSARRVCCGCGAC